MNLNNNEMNGNYNNGVNYNNGMNGNYNNNTNYNNGMNGNYNNNTNYNNGMNGNYNNGVNLQYALTKDRLFAFLWDTLHMILFSFVFFIVMTIISFLGIYSDLISKLKIIFSILILLFGAIFAQMFTDFKDKPSFGRRKRNIKVVTVSGNNITCGSSIVRGILKLIEINFPIVLIISFVMMISSKKKQSLHDMILNQVVIKTNKNI